MPPPDLYRATVRYTWNRPSGPHYTSGARVGLHGANGRAEGARVRTADGEWGGARAREKSSEDRGWRGSRRGASLLRKAVWQLVAERVSEPRDSRDLAAAFEACDPTLEEEIRGRPSGVLSKARSRRLFKDPGASGSGWETGAAWLRVSDPSRLEKIAD